MDQQGRSMSNEQSSIPHNDGNIVLVGFMGSGKSTVAEVLSEGGFERIDLDALIVERSGRSIPEIFAQEGEAAFRDIETETLRSLRGVRGTVISTGGGIVGREENWDMMRAFGPVIYLRAEWETLRRRLATGEGRPLAKKDDWGKVEALWQQRLPLYAQADHIVDTENCDPSEVADRIMRIFKTEAGSQEPGARR
jgi:shikimate kinase